jgi:hypothetical protein
MLVAAKPEAHFSKECVHPSPRPLISTTHPHLSSIRELIGASLTLAAKHFEDW